jgi:23S rRNA pseudouridine1911/1915/1917 synthase
MKEYHFKVTSHLVGKRLDLFLSEFAQGHNLGISRTYIQKLITDGKVSINGSIVKERHHKVKDGDDVLAEVEEKKASGISAEIIPLEVVYEDDDLALINKPSGLVVHPAPGNYEHTLVNALLARFKHLSSINPARPGIVHRLDKETSGLVVIAKNNNSHLALAKQFAKHTINRTYIAVVKGKVEFNENVIELPIGRHPVKRKSMAVSFSENTKYAKTHYRVLRRTKDYSVLELKPFTGRTHQLRVHCSFIGYPILGDSKYGKSSDAPRLMLHAQSLGFIHPRTKKLIEFTSGLPEEFTQYTG